jgi:putative transposase
MPRPPRVDVGGYAYHVLNRSVGRRTIFRRNADFIAFEHVLAEAIERSAGDVELLAYCLMGNHWHLVLHTTADGALSPFMQWLTLTHTHRYRWSHRNAGDGPLYQGRFKSFAIELESHLLTVCRYVERNAARASRVERAEDWRWSSLWRSRQRGHVDSFVPPLALSEWPLPGGRPRGWLRTVNTPLKDADLEALRLAAARCRPYGGKGWVDRQVKRFGLESTIRPRGRPRKPKPE